MTQASEQRIVALMFTDLVGSVGLQNRLGTEAYTRFIGRHDQIFKACLGHAKSGEILNETGDGFLVQFDTPSEAVNMALRLQAAMYAEVCEGEKMQLRIGLHMGAITEMDEGVRGEKRTVGMAINLAARIMDLADAGQILMTRAVFDEARQFVREHPDLDKLPEAAVLQWPAHGRYIFKGNDDPLEIYEVGAEGMALLSPPEGEGKAKRAVAADEEDTLGWRPGAGLAIPRMEDWVVEKQLGAGGFGEVWLAKHQTSKEERVFKFCFDPERLRSFRRELTLFRLLRDALGKRDDIAALYDVSVEMPPFYLESEYVPHGNLVQWIESEGGIATVPMETRLDLLARTARAVDAAHSVGIVHKDIKPSNILIALKNGEPRPRLADFGIGAVTDSSALSDFGITRAGFTQSVASDGDSGSLSMTQLYAPPEYLVGGKPDPKGDIYSLGVMLYQLASGDLKRPLASGWRRDIPDALLAEIIEKCVDVDPERRYDSAGQLAERLETLDERRVQRAELQRVEELREQANRRRRMLVVGALICAGLVALSAVLAKSYFNQKELTESQKQLTEEAEQLRLEARQLASQSDFLLAGQHIAQDRRSTGVAYLARSLRSDPSNRSAAIKLFSTLANHRFTKPHFPALQIHDGGKVPNRFFFGSFDSKLEKFVGQNAEAKLTIFDLATASEVGEPFDHSGETPRDVVFVDGDTKILASVMDGGSPRESPTRLKLWDASTGRLIRQQPQGESTLLHISLAPDGSHWIAAEILDEEFNFKLQFWDLRAAEEWRTFYLPKPKGVAVELIEYRESAGRFVCVTILSDARRHIGVLDVAGVSPEQWEGAEWNDVGTLESWAGAGYQSSPVVSPDGRWLALAKADGSLQIFDLNERKLELAIEEADGLVISSRFSPSGERLAIGYFGSGTSTAAVWDVTAKQQLPLEVRHDSGISSVGFSPDGNSLMTGSMDGSARLWDIEGGRPLTEPLGPHGGMVVFTGFSADGTLGKTMSMDGTVSVWKLAGSAARPVPLTADISGVEDWTLSPDGSWIVANRRQSLLVRKIDGGRGDDQVIETESAIGVAMAGNNDQLFVERRPSKLDCYDLKTGTKETFEIPNLGLLLAGGASDDGSVVITNFGRNRESFAVWRLNSEKPEPFVMPHGDRTTLASVSGDGRRAVTATTRQTFAWDLELDDPQPRQLDVGLTLAHTLNRDGTKLLTGTVDGIVRLWDFETGLALTRNLVQTGQVVALALSPDERLAAGLAVSQREGRQFADVMVWDLATEEVVMDPVQLPNTGEIKSVGIAIAFEAFPQLEFSRDLTHLIVAWEDVVSRIDLAPAAGDAVPDWVPELAEAIAGRRLEDGKMVANSSRAAATVPETGSAGLDKQVEDWGTWLLEDDGDRRLSPASDWAQRDYQDYLLGEGTDASLRELLQISPAEPRALAVMAGRLSGESPRRAVHYSQLAQAQLGRGEHSPEVRAKAYQELARVEAGLGSPESLRRAVRLAGLAVENDAGDLSSRSTMAQALDRLSVDPSGGSIESESDPRPRSSLAAVWFEVLFSLGWKDLRSTLDRGFPTATEWKYDDSGEPARDSWPAPEFNDRAWKAGPGPFGFGDDRTETSVESGPVQRRHATTYFRKVFPVADLADFANPMLRYRRDDGVVIYLNGLEIARDNMPDGAVSFNTFAVQAVGDVGESVWYYEPVSPEILHVGKNVLAVEVHQSGFTSSDLYFELELFSHPSTGADLLRGDGVAIEEHLGRVPELSAAQKAEFRAVFAADVEQPSAFVALARAVRAHLQGESEAALEELQKMPEPPEGEGGRATIKAKANLLELLGDG